MVVSADSELANYAESTQMWLNPQNYVLKIGGLSQITFAFFGIF